MWCKNATTTPGNIFRQRIHVLIVVRSYSWRKIQWRWLDGQRFKTSAAHSQASTSSPAGQERRLSRAGMGLLTSDTQNHGAQKHHNFLKDSGTQKNLVNREAPASAISKALEAV
jgi:hypothetical protein